MILGTQDGITVISNLAGPISLIGRTVLQEYHGGNLVGVLATGLGLHFFKDIHVDETLFDVLTADGSLAQNEVTVLGHSLEGFRILVGGEEVLAADEGQVHGSGPVGEVQGEYPAAFLVLGSIGRGEGGHFDHGSFREDGILRIQRLHLGFDAGHQSQSRSHHTI